MLAAQNGSTAAEQDKRQRADEFGDQFVQVIRVRSQEFPMPTNHRERATLVATKREHEGLPRRHRLHV